MIKIDPIDASDPGKAAMANFAAMWLFPSVSGMHAANAERERNGDAHAYGDESYGAAIEDAKQMRWHEGEGLPLSAIAAADVRRVQGDGGGAGYAEPVPAAPTGD